jgi:hypothetical protein
MTADDKSHVDGGDPFTSPCKGEGEGVASCARTES